MVTVYWQDKPGDFLNSQSTPFRTWERAEKFALRVTKVFKCNTQLMINDDDEPKAIYSFDRETGYVERITFDWKN